MPKFSELITKTREKATNVFGSSFYHDPITLVMFTIFSLLTVALLLLLIFKVQPSSTQFPLTYNVVYGVTYTATWYGLYSYLLALVGFGAINYLVAWAYFDKERLLSYLLGSVNILLAALTILYVYNLLALSF